MQDYQLSDIYIYPIKSLGAIRLDNTKTTEKGLQYDRRWMLIDTENNFMTIRRNVEFLFFKLSMTDHGFRVAYKGDALEVPFDFHSDEEITCSVWDDEVIALKGKSNWNKWFSEKIGRPCSLVYMPEESNRVIKPMWGGTSVSFADGYPLLVVGEESLKELNHKLESPVEMMRFRPNLVFNGGKAYDEFNWSTFKIGEVEFQGLKPCARCIVTTYDPKTGEKDREPLLTLSKQKIDGNIVFGQHSKSVDSGVISEGDSIKILSHKSEPYAPIDGLSL